MQHRIGASFAIGLNGWLGFTSLLNSGLVGRSQWRVPDGCESLSQRNGLFTWRYVAECGLERDWTPIFRNPTMADEEDCPWQIKEVYSPFFWRPVDLENWPKP